MLDRTRTEHDANNRLRRIFRRQDAAPALQTTFKFLRYIPYSIA